MTADYRTRFARAYDDEVQAWVDGVRQGTGPVGASAWDGYAATAVSTAGMASLATGRPVPVRLAPRPALYAAATDPVAGPSGGARPHSPDLT